MLAIIQRVVRKARPAVVYNFGGGIEETNIKAALDIYCPSLVKIRRVMCHLGHLIKLLSNELLSNELYYITQTPPLLLCRHVLFTIQHNVFI